MNENALDQFVNLYFGTSLSQRLVFTSEVVDRIGEEFGIPAGSRDEVGGLLEAGSEQWARETRRASLDLARIRKELRKLEKAANAALNAVDTISDETLGIMFEAGIGLTLLGYPLPRLSMHETSPVLEFAAAYDDENHSISLSEIRSSLAALSQCASDSQPTAGASHKGRPAHEGLFDLLHIAFQIWTSVLGRAFKLDWASDGDPITDAAKFCERIARIVDPSLTLQQIATTARKVREKCMSISNLEEVPEVLDHFRKQFE